MSGSNEAAWLALGAGIALKSTIVLTLAWLAALLLRAQSAAARHLVWIAAIVAVLALPVLQLFLPAFSVPLPTPAAIGAFTTSASSEVAPHALPPRNPAAGLAPQSAAWHFHWRLSLILLWAAGALLALARMSAALADLSRARSSATPAKHSGLAAALAHELGVRHPVDVLETAADTMPMTFGLLRPGIFLPATADQWSPGRLRVVLLHELAHIRRRDVATHFLSRLLVALHWWNPLAHLAWRESLKERERAADDLVLRAGTLPSDYAAHLLEAARTMRMPASFAALAMARPQQLEARLAAILDSRAKRSQVNRAFAVAVVALAATLAVPLAAVRAQVRSLSSLPSDVDATIRAARAGHSPAMLDTSAALFEASRQYDTARKLYESAEAIRAEASGANSADYGIGLLKLGDLEQHRNRRAEAGAFYAQAIQILGARPETAAALTFQGVTALANKNVAQASDYFEQARRLGGPGATSATMWLALARERDAHPTEAEELYRSALAAEPAESADAAIIATLLGHLLQSQGHSEEAEALADRAAAIRKARQAAPAPLSPNVFRIAEGVSAPRVLSKTEPHYSDEARLAKLQGTVIVSVEIGADGQPHTSRVLSSLGLGLDEEALSAIDQWRFQPGMMGETPVNVLATIEVHFRLL